MEKNLSRTKERTLESLSFNTFCGWWGYRRGKCFAKGSAQLSSSFLTAFSVASLKLPTSGRSLPDLLTFSCPDPSWDHPQSTLVLPFVFHLMVQQVVCVSCFTKYYFTGFLIWDLSHQCPELDGIHFHQSCFSSCTFLSLLFP